MRSARGLPGGSRAAPTRVIHVAGAASVLATAGTAVFSLKGDIFGSHGVDVFVPGELTVVQDRADVAVLLQDLRRMRHHDHGGGLLLALIDGLDAARAESVVADGGDLVDHHAIELDGERRAEREPGPHA